MYISSFVAPWALIKYSDENKKPTFRYETAATHVCFCGKSPVPVREQYYYCYYYVSDIINNDDKSKPLQCIILCVQCTYYIIDKA